MRTYLDLDLTGLTAVVTGASSGIGRAIAEALAEAGANIVLVGRDASRLQETAALVQARGVAAEPVIVELTADDAPQTIVDAAVKQAGGAVQRDPGNARALLLNPAALLTSSGVPGRFAPGAWSVSTSGAGIDLGFHES